MCRIFFRCLFLSTPSARRATKRRPGIISCCGDFYPRPPRGGRLHHRVGQDAVVLISIHALREEGDEELEQKKTEQARFLSTPSARRATQKFWKRLRRYIISIHALREEGDVYWPNDSTNIFDFYPRPPRGGRRGCWVRCLRCSTYFYPRPPRGGRRAGR